VRGLVCRGPRFRQFLGIAFALAMVQAPVAWSATRGATETTLALETRDLAGHTRAMLDVNVAGEDRHPAMGGITIEDGGRELAGAALDAEGNAHLVLDLTAGEHSLRAVYLGDQAHASSASEPMAVHGMASTTPDFSVSVSPAKMTLPLGQSGSVVATLTPVNNAALTSPMFVTLSCQGLPDQSSCTFTPENLEILNTTPTACTNTSPKVCPPTSTMVVQTQLGTSRLAPPARAGNGTYLALVLPGALALIGLGWRRKRFMRLTLLSIGGFLVLAGSSACNSRYNYFNHGPPHNPPTPAGTYTLTVSAQSSNGITAITHTTTMVLTVQ